MLIDMSDLAAPTPPDIEIQKHKYLNNSKTLALFEREVNIARQLDHVCIMLSSDTAIAHD